MAWIIDKDHIAEPGAEEGTNLNAVGLIGSSDVSEESSARLRAGEGEPFRMLDDDDILYYEGRWLETDDTASLEAAEFQPLDNFGTPNAGCTKIQYKNAQGVWESI